jgi:hypothetical protein
MGPARKADNITAIYEPIFWKMWEPRRLISLWTSTASHRGSFTCFVNKEFFNDFIAFPSLLEADSVIRVHVRNMRDFSTFIVSFSRNEYLCVYCALGTNEFFNSMDIVDNNIVT